MDYIEDGKNVLMGTYGRFPIVLERGEGPWVWDTEGKRYLDFTCGISVNNLGQCHPAIVQAVQKQAAKMFHCSNLYWSIPQVALAEKLVSYSGLGKVFFCNSGAEANEGAIKLARKYFYDQGQTDKNEIITMVKSFHGRTLATLTATGQDKVKTGFAPLMPGFHYVPYNDFEGLAAAVNDRTCAVMMEPIQGEGGVYPADAGYLKKVRSLCEEKGLLLIFDEIQCGMGRTGTMFAYENYGVRPDIVTLAKALGGGLPMGAFIATDEVSASFGPGSHGSTFGGNPVAAAAGNAYLETVAEKHLLDNVKTVSAYLKDQLAAIDDSRIKEIRGMGLLLGMEMTVEVAPMVNSCLKQGLLLLNAGPNVIRFLPPLNITEELVDSAVAILKKVFKEEA
ncbi:MAG TPA: acetylornithine transaminase [Firmicutes bacterium]|nr:acetylornithine transaminase [Bacillota bacterium]